MMKKLKSIIDTAMLKSKLVEKQRLYAQMLKDNLHGGAMAKLSEEIGSLTIQIHGKSQEQA
jgi:hypothetical protein